MERITESILLLFACGGAFGQSVDARIQFEVASVKPVPLETTGGSSGGMRGGPGTGEPTHFTSNNMSLATLLYRAYDIKRAQLSGPSWLDTEKFNIEAKLAEGTTPAQFRLMLQDLLAERFKLKLHHENKEMPIYELVVAKNGPKLKESAGAAVSPVPGGGDPYAVGDDGYPAPRPGENGTRVTNFHARMQHAQISMEEFVKQLNWPAGRMVRDATGLKGKYDIEMKYIPSGAPENVSGPTLFSAIQDQLGLRLESKKGPVDTLVIDHVERVPTGN